MSPATLQNSEKINPDGSWEVVKTIGLPGKVVVPGSKPGDRPLSYRLTRKFWEKVADTANAKVKDGWNIPLCWEHQDVSPDRLQLSEKGRKDRDFALGVFGKGAEFSVGRDGRLLARLRGNDPKDLQQFKNVEFVSPELQWNWMDTEGKVWDGPTVTHIAATPRPVQKDQESVLEALRGQYTRQPGAFAAVRMSHQSFAVNRVDRSMSNAPTRLRLSLSNYAEIRPMAAENDDELEMLEGEDATDTGDGTDTETDAPQDTGETAVTPKEGDGKGKASPWQRIADSLSQHCGLLLGDLTDVKDADDFATRVEIAAMNYAGGGEDEEGDEPEESDDMDDMGDEPATGDLNAPPADAAIAQPPPVQMSQRAHAAQIKQAEALARRNLADEINSLRNTRRVTPVIAESLAKEVKSIRLSFNGNTGELEPNTLTAKIEAYKVLPPNHAWRPQASGKPSPKPSPKPGGKKARKLALSQRGSGRTAPAKRSQYEDDPPADDEQTVESFFAITRRGTQV